MRVRTELYHKAISVESPGQGALSNRELESLTRGFQTSPQKPETPEEELLKLLSRGAEFQLESRPGPKQSELSKKRSYYDSSRKSNSYIESESTLYLGLGH